MLKVSAGGKIAKGFLSDTISSFEVNHEAITPGLKVHKKDTLLDLAAMKMENVNKSPGTGFVKNIEDFS
jgi:biotin carboxyl carrier protein